MKMYDAAFDFTLQSQQNLSSKNVPSPRLNSTMKTNYDQQQQRHTFLLYYLISLRKYLLQVKFQSNFKLLSTISGIQKDEEQQ